MYSITEYIVPPIVAVLDHETRNIRHQLLIALRHGKLHKLNDLCNDKWLQRLAAQRVLTLDAKGYIDALYPLSVKPTNKRVYFEDGSMAYAMCAIDAIGCHYAFNEPIRIESECEACRHPLILSLDKGNINIIQGSKDIHVLHTDLSLVQNWSCTCCNIMHFFDCAERLHTWISTHCSTEKKVFPLDLQTANKVAWLLFSQ